jgi:hypothetical protein
VDDRVSAYQGNTKPLEQRYAMSQDLLDLLALQKIKSQKEAAARQMQLQMAQQSAQDGQASMTVAQQREQEVSELTKNELAQQRGDTAQKQVGDQQAMMQKMMSGVAAAPGANAVAQPKMFASGGIIGFNGTQGSDVNLKPEQVKQKLAEAVRNRDVEKADFYRKWLETNAMPERPQAPPRVVIPRGLRDPVRVVQPQTTQTAAANAITPAAADAGLEKKLAPQAPAAAAAATPKPPAGPVAPRPPAGPAAAAAGPAMPSAAGPAGPAAAAGPAALPPVQLGAVGPANDFGTKLQAAALKNAEIDPSVRQLTEEQRVEARTALTPEQRKVYEEGIGGLQKMYQEQYDPERQRREGITRALIGAGGRNYGEFAGAAEAGMRYNDQQRAAKLKEFGNIQDARTGLIGIDRTNVKDAIGAGQKAYEQSSMGQRQGLQSGAGMYGDDVKSRDTRYNIDVGSRDNVWKMNEESRNKVLDRAIEQAKVAAQNAATSATREGLSQDRARTVYSATVARVQELERKLDNDFKTGPMGLLLQQDPSKLKPEDKNRLDIANLELERQKTRLRKEMEPVLADARRKLGVTDTNLSPEDKAVVDKYAKGK